MSNKQSLLEHLNREKEGAESWVVRNTKDGYPEAAAGWQEKLNQIKRWIDLVEGLETPSFNTSEGFHKLWSRCVGTEHYDKSAWKSVEKQIESTE